MEFEIICNCLLISFLILSLRCGSSLDTTVDKKEIESRSKISEKCEDGLDQLRKEIDSLKEAMIYAKVENKLLREQKDKELLQHVEENKLLREQKDKELLKQYEEMQTKLNGVMGMVKTGVSYVRWGRTTCPTPSATLYTGHIGSSGYGDKGGGVNYLCLPRHPEWGNRRDGMTDYTSKIYGTEYEFFNSPIFSLHSNGGLSLHDLDALCAMCFVPNRSAQIMIPAKRTCPEGWTMEYRGYLVTHVNQYSSKDFVCMDEAPEGLTGSYANLDGAVLYPVEGVCGSLPCPPYVNGWELACVVCSK